MKTVIDFSNTNGFRAMASLKRAAEDTRIEAIEGAGMDEGRVFLHLKRGFIFSPDFAHLKSVGSAAELKSALTQIVACDCESCK
jgi:hypothetical protein